MRQLLKKLLCLMALPLLAGCWNNSITRNFRIIATAVVDGKEVQGTSVFKATWTEASGRGNYVDEEGEAVILDLKGHGTVYVLSSWMNKDNAYGCSWACAVGEALGVRENGNSSEFPKIMAAQGRHPIKYDYGNGYAIIIVGFHNEARKDSVYRILPNEFDKAFGPGVTFKSLEFEPTDEPVTQALLQRLPMLGIDDMNNLYHTPPVPGHLKALSDQSFAELMGDGLFFEPYLGKSFYANRKQVK